MRVSWIIGYRPDPSFGWVQGREARVAGFIGEDPAGGGISLSRRGGSPESKGEAGSAGDTKKPVGDRASWSRAKGAVSLLCVSDTGEHALGLFDAFEANDALTDGVADQVGAVAGVELGHDMGLVGFDRLP